MRFLSLLLFLCGVVGLAFAQNEKPITDWVQLERPEDEFSLEVPKGFEFERSRDSDDKISARGEFQTSAERFYIFVDTRREPFQRRYAEQYLALNSQHVSPIDLAGRDAAKAEFEDPTGYYHRIVFTHTATRVFTLHTVSRHKVDQIAIRFINSFKLVPRIIVDGTSTHAPFPPVPSRKADASPSETASGGGSQRSGSGEGSGSGSSSNSGKDGNTTLPMAEQTKDELKVLYRHKASYTDFARFYNIQGTVLLRVVFLASGEIGSTTNIRTLPFGLTESAINAAKLMKFEPEKVNGVARTTSRPVSFSFSIY